jgi:hypothetical protein
MVDTPAGVFLTRLEAELVHRSLLHDNSDEARALRDRIRRYLDSDWEARARVRATALGDR